MSESNSVRVSLVQRTSFATPATLNMLVLPTTGQSIRNVVGYTQSQTIRTDANVQDLIRLSQSAGGGIPFELQFPVVNEAIWFLLRAVMRAVEDAERVETGCTSTGGGTSVTIGSGTWTSGAPVDVQIGDVVKLTGTASPTTDGFRRVINITSGNTILTLDGPDFVGTDATTTVVRGARMKNGTTRYYFDVEVSRLDITPTPLHELFRQMVVDGMSLTVSDTAITTAQLSLVGITSERLVHATGNGVGYTNPTAGPVLDALGVPVFNYGGTAYSAKSISFTIANNVRTRTQIGTLGGTALPFGSFDVKTQSSSYMANFTEMNKFTGNTPSSFWFVMQNSNSQALSFSFPQHKWSDLATDTRGLNQDDYMDGSGQAYLHPTELCTMRVQRWTS